MLGKIKAENKKSIVDPLKALNNVLSDKTDGVHVVYEFEDDSVHIGARDVAGNTFGMYELAVNEVVEGYKKPKEDIGIYDVIDFVNKFSLYSDEVDISFDGNNVISFSNETDNVDYYTSSVDQIKKGKRKLKTELLDIGASVILNTQVKKLQQAMSSFVGQDVVRFYAEEGSSDLIITIKSEVKNSNSYKTIIKNATVETGVDLEFSKEQIQKVLSCNDEFDFTFYSGKKNILEVSYSKDHYSMKFYISPKAS